VTARFLICPSVGLDQRSYSMSCQVGTGMGDHFWVGKSPQYVASHPWSTQPCHPPWVGAMSTGDGFGHCMGRKREVCITEDTVIRTARYKLKWQPSSMYHLLIASNCDNGSSTIYSDSDSGLLES